MIKINEIYYSIQGESTKAGLPCVFIRLTYCNLRCTYCDTEYAFYEGEERSINYILDEIKQYNCKLVEVTGGEPLVQKDAIELMYRLCDEGYEVLLETGGSLPIDKVDNRVKIILDLKCPSSGMMKKNLYANIDYLKPIDEVKFVIGNFDDYKWAKEQINKYQLDAKCEVLFSVVFGKLEPIELIKWITDDKIECKISIADA
jgi:7-carboxy-7-deazaguanine synthase